MLDSALPDDVLDQLELCEDRIGYEFEDVHLLKRCLTHTSAARTRLDSNERLEFLGDAILGSVICERLYHNNPEQTEGELTQSKSAIVSRKSCAHACQRMRITECIFVGRGISQTRRMPSSIEAGVIEALIAGIFLDGGFEAARDVIVDWFADELCPDTDTDDSPNYKSDLQQYVQSRGLPTPRYEVQYEQGPDHSKRFLITAVVGDEEFPPAWGNSKKKAEQRAAGNAMATLLDEDLPFPEQ